MFPAAHPSKHAAHTAPGKRNLLPRMTCGVRQTKAVMLAFFLLCAAVVPSAAQPDFSGAAEIKSSLDRLNVLGSVLMIAAHPDDENTALLAYLARGRKLRTAYLSLTRGEGGQNLIGSDQSEALGIIRTQELLAARRLDGAEQYFTRAIDFGFSKSADETLTKWGREETLADTVWVIRSFRPDVIVLRFSGTSRDGHGHHQSSAILGQEAFRAAADPHRFPEQLRHVRPWRARRLLWNVAAFTQEQQQAAAQLRQRLEIEIGDYNPVLGYSYGEIAGMSRSMHRSQGMGSSERRGSVRNSFTVADGEPAAADLMDGIDTTWTRVPGGAEAGRLLERAAREFRIDQPETAVPALLEARRLLAAADDPWAALKRREIDETIALCSGLWLDASAARHTAVAGATLRVSLTALNRSPLAISLDGIRIGDQTVAVAGSLERNRPASQSIDWKVPADRPYSPPYWLESPASGDRYTVAESALIGTPESAPVAEAHFRLRFGQDVLELSRPVIQRYVDAVLGEKVRPLVLVPAVAVEVPERVIVFPNSSPKPVVVQIAATVGAASGSLRLDAPPGWQVEPASRGFSLTAAGETTALRFSLAPGPGAASGTVRAIATVGGRDVSVGMKVIDYPHIPPQTLFPPARAELRRLEVRNLARKVGYVMGAGDDIPRALRQLGSQVTLLESEDLAQDDLSAYDAIVTGVRAFNVRPDLRASRQRLMDYVNNGGTLIIQYNVLERGPSAGRSDPLAELGPFPLRIGRDRVTVEEAPVRFLSPEHPLMKTPNVITQADFEGWVQERGLYFASDWDERYQPLWESSDPGDRPLAGGTLYARYGKGVYIFTAYSWFRQLPAGVGGAYRIFANFLSAGRSEP